MTEINTNALDAMLNYVAASANLKLCLCQTEPLVLADCSSQSGPGGKRVTVEHDIVGEITLADGLNAQSRKMVLASQIMTNGATVAVDVGVSDLWLAVYNSTEILLKSDQITNEAVVSGSTVTTPAFEWGVNQ